MQNVLRAWSVAFLGGVLASGAAAQTVATSARLDAYGIRAADLEGAYAAANRAQSLDVTFAAQGLEVAPSAPGARWRWSMELIGYGRGARAEPVSPAELCAAGQRIEYRRGAVVEWYVNDPRGVEQGFTLIQPPEESAPSAEKEALTLELRLHGTLAAERSADGLLLRDSDGARALEYRDLVAWDAAHRVLPTRMELDGERVRLVVDDRGAIWPLTVDPLIVTEQAKLTASDAAAADGFGVSVSLWGDTILVGASGDNTQVHDSGSAYVFVRSGTQWVEQSKLTASDAQEQDSLGTSVSLWRDTALVGASRVDDQGDEAGAAYVFARSGSTWSEQAKLTANDGEAFDFFGTTVALSGDTAMAGVSADGDKRKRSGSVYVFSRNGTVWTQQTKLTPLDIQAKDAFGGSVALADDTAVVGAVLEDEQGQNAGAAYVFRRSGTLWTEQAKLTASDGAPDDLFGFSVAVSGDTAIVGAVRDDDNAPNSGSAYVFVRNGSVWTEQAKLTASDPAATDWYGYSVAVWNDVAVVGVRSDDDQGPATGSAYVYVRDGTVWREEAKLTASDAAKGDEFGGAVAMYEDTALIGARGNQDAGFASGSAYVFVVTSVPEPMSYCTAKTGLVCGRPAIGSSGAPSASASSGFVIHALPAQAGELGLFLYTAQGRAAFPFDGGTLCLTPPLMRSPAVDSGGASSCSGVFAIDWNAFARGALGGGPEPFLLEPGQPVDVQVWGRDSAATGSFLSDALEYVVDN